MGQLFGSTSDAQAGTSGGQLFSGPITITPTIKTTSSITKKTATVKKVTPTKKIEPISSTKYKISGVDFGRLGQSVKSGAELVPSQLKTAGGIILSAVARNSERANQFFGKIETAQNIIRPKFIEKATAQVRAQKRLGNQALEVKATQLREAGAKEATKKLEDVSKRMTPSTGLQSYLEMAAFNLPQMAATTGLTIATGIVTRNPALATTVGLSTSYGLGASEVYSEARRGGLKDAEAMPLAQVGGTLIGAIDFVPLGRLLRKTGAIKTIEKSIIRKVAQGVVSLGTQAGFEGVTEGVQEIIGNAIKSTYKENQNLFEGVTEATAVGTLLGGFSDVTVAGVTGAIGNKATPEKVVDHVNKQIEKALNTPPNKRTQEQELLVRTMSERVVTPDEAIAMVIDMGIEKTEVGRKLVLASLEAKQADQDVRITQNRSAREINLEVVDKDSAIQQEETPPLSPTEETVDRGVVEEGSTEPKDPLIQEARKYKSAEEFVKAQELPQVLRGTKGLTADDIMKTYPNIKLTRDVPATDIYGNKAIIPDGEKLTPYELKGNRILLQDGETYIVTKNQFQNIKGQSVGGEAKPFAPELEGTEERTFGGDKKFNTISQEEMGELADMRRKMETTDLTSTERQRWNELQRKNELAKESVKDNQTRYSQYQLPDGKNYKEVLIKAQDTSMSELEKLGFEFRKSDKDNFGNKGVEVFKNGQSMGHWPDLEKAKKAFGRETTNFKSSHWDEPNVISHLRLNERTYKGKKVTFMEELQSDWAREGRSKGFENRDLIKKWQELDDKSQKGTLTPAEKIEYTRLGGMKEVQSGAIPNNPLLKNWQILSIKRALLDAVNSDAEYFAWINGEQTSARYNLATHVENVDWERANRSVNIVNGRPVEMTDRKISITPIGGAKKIEVFVDEKGVVRGGDNMLQDWKGKKLDEVLGKGLADKIMADKEGTLSGEGLKFGGEWASNLYDKQVKVIVEDLTGGKVEVIDMKLPIDKKPESFHTPRGSEGGTRHLKVSDLKVNKHIVRTGEGSIKHYIITDVIGDGKFRAVEKSFYDSMKGRWLDMEKDKNWMSRLGSGKETFDMSQRYSTQQAIKLTPEIKARIRGEAPQIKTSGKQFEDTRAKLTDIWNKANENKKSPIEEEADRSLLMSELAKQEAEKETPQSKKVVEELTEKQQAVEQVKQENQAKKSILEQFEPKQIVAMRTIKRSINSLESKGLDPTSVSKTESYKNHIEDVMAAIGTDSEDVALQYIREDLPDSIIPAATREQLQEIRVLKSRIQPKEVPVQRSQLPVGEGKVKASRLEARMKGVLDQATPEQIEELGLSIFNTMNKKETISKAAEYVTENPEDAMRVLRGTIQPPEGIPPEAIYIALVQRAKGDLTLATKLASLQATSIGQRLSLLTELDPNSPVKLLNEVYKVREEIFKKKYGGKSIKEVSRTVTEQIQRSVKKPDKYDWNTFISNLEC